MHARRGRGSTIQEKAEYIQAIKALPKGSGESIASQYCDYNQRQGFISATLTLGSSDGLKPEASGRPDLLSRQNRFKKRLDSDCGV